MDFEALIGKVVDFLLTTGVRVLIALLIFIVGWKLIDFFIRKFVNSKAVQKTDPTLRSFLSSFLSIAAKVLLTVTVIAYLGVPMTSIVTAIASCGVAVGLAMQGGLSNLAGGVMLLFMKPFKIGDVVTASGQTGTVMSIGIFYTTLRTVDNVHIHIPNGGLMNGVIVNNSAEETRRIDFLCTAAYECDGEKVRKTLLALAEKDERVLKDPGSAAYMTAFHDSAVEYTLRVWCRSENYWDLYLEIPEKIKNAFAEAQISIPFPQLDVHVVSEEKEKAK